MTIIQTGQLVKTDKTKHQYELKRLTLDSFNEVHELQHEIVANMAIKEYCTALTNQELEHVLGEKGITIGTYIEGELIGFHSILFPELSEENLGYDVGFSEADLRQSAHLEIVVIHPDFRGNSLQSIMADQLLAMVKSMNEHRYIFETVHPLNIPSVRNTFAHDLLVVQLKEKYEGTLRYIMMQDLHTPIKYAEDTTKRVLSTEIAKQQQYLQEGYVGYNLVREEDKTYMLYAKRI